METFSPITGASRKEKAKSAERRCIATGETLPKASLIRFAIDDSGNLIPDISEKLPGRGIWVSASRKALDQAVHKNLFARAAKESKTKVASDIATTVVALLHRRCLELLGQSKGAGAVVTGQPQVEQALKAGKLAFVIAADGAGMDGLKKLGSAVVLQCGFSRAELAQALGRDDAVYVGLKPHGLTEKLEKEARRYVGVVTG